MPDSKNVRVMKKYAFSFFWLLLAIGEWISQEHLWPWMIGCLFVVLAANEAIVVKVTQPRQLGEEKQDTPSQPS